MKVESKVTAIAGAAHRGLVPKVRPDCQGVTTQDLRIVASVDWKHLGHDVSSHPVRHQGREMRLQLIQLRCRAAM
jgi:hypothetical protein